MKLDFQTDFKVGDIVWTCGVDKLQGYRVKREQVRITEVQGGPFKYKGAYVSDGDAGFFMEDELVRSRV